MRGILVFDLVSSDVVYYDFDPSYHSYLVDLCFKKGLFDPPKLGLQSYGPDNEQWMNALMQLFSILVQSQTAMQANFQNAYESVSLDGGTEMAFHAVDKYFFVHTTKGDSGMSSGGEESEALHTRMKTSLVVLHKIVHFLHGPAFHKLKPASVAERIDEWKLVSGIHRAWWTLYDIETSFLTRAAEHLNFSELTLRRIDDVLQRAVGELEKIGDRNVTHALLVSGAKIISHYVSPLGQNLPALGSSSGGASAQALGMRQKIQPYDTLFILALIQNYYGTGDIESYIQGELLKFTCSPQSVSVAATADHDNHDNSKVFEERRRSPLQEFDPAKGVEPNEPGCKHTNQIKPGCSDAIVSQPDMVDFHRRASNISEDDFLSSREDNDLSDASDDDSDTKDAAATRGINEMPSKIRLDVTPAAVGRPGDGRPGRSGWEETPSAAARGGDVTPSADDGDASRSGSFMVADSLDIITWNIFLTFAGDHHHPHKIHLVPIHQGIILVTLTALGSQLHSNVFNNCIKQLEKVLRFSDKNYQPPSLATLEAAVRGSVQILRQLRQSGDAILNLWNRIKARGLQVYLENHRKSRSPSSMSRTMSRVGESTTGSAEEEKMSPLLETLLNNFLDKVKGAFNAYINTRNNQLPSAETYARKLYSMQKHLLMPVLHDFKDFLQVKSRRNTTGSHYIELYPGLLHFVYVDRLTNRVTAPSLVPVESPHDEGGKQMDIKDLIWKKFLWGQRQLQRGYTSLTLVEGQLHFSYFVVSGLASQALAQATPTPAPRQPTLFDPISLATLPVGLDDAPPPLLTHPQDFFHALLKSTLFPSVTVPAATSALHPRDVVCVELLCVHSAVLPTTVIFDQCSQLLAELRQSG